MAKKKIELNDGELPLAMQAIIGEADEIEQAFAELPSEDTKIAVYRMRDQGRSAYIQSYSLSEFSIDTLHERHGGGKFKLVAKTKNQVQAERIVEIEGSPIIRTAYPRAESGGRGGGIGGWGSRDGEAMQSFVQGAYSDPMLTIVQELKELRREMSKPHNDGILALLTQLITSKSTSGDDIEEKLLNRLASFKNLFGGSESKVESNIIFDAIKSGMEMVSNAESREGSPWLTLAERALPMIQNLVAQASQAQATRTGPASQLHNATPPIANLQSQPQAPPIPDIPKTGFASIAPQLAPYLPTFIQAAAVDSDPNLLVDLTIANIPEANKIIVIEWLQSGTWEADLIGLNQAVSLQRRWWQEYHDLLLENLAGKNVEPDSEQEQ